MRTLNARRRELVQRRAHRMLLKHPDLQPVAQSANSTLMGPEPGRPQVYSMYGSR